MTSAAMIEPAVAAQGLKLHRGATFGEVSNALHCFDNREKPPMPKSGTTGAITYLRIGGPADSARTQPRRGGARNCRDRQSDSLNPRQVGDLIAAARHATAVGLPLNRMITIHWEKAGVRPLSIARANGRFLDLLGKAIARHGGKTAQIWVQESGEHKGGHCHILVHVPSQLVDAVTRLQIGWLKAITGNKYRCKVIKSEPVGGRLGLETGNPALHANNLDAALSYVLKGASGDAAQAFGLTRLEHGGRLIGKRCGTSQNIGAKARKTKD